MKKALFTILVLLFLSNIILCTFTSCISTKKYNRDMKNLQYQFEVIQNDNLIKKAEVIQLQDIIIDIRNDAKNYVKKQKINIWDSIANVVVKKTDKQTEQDVRKILNF